MAEEQALEALDLLLERDSAQRLTAPAPGDEALEIIFRSAVRAPDHGRLRPWRFVVIPEQALPRFGDLLADSLRRDAPDTPPGLLERERAKALRAPMIVVVAARLTPSPKIPEIEQILSAGAAAQTVLLAAQAQGFGAVWKTGRPAYDDEIKRALGLEPTDAIVGFIYLGTRVGGPSPVARPNSTEFVSTWNG
jgi:nitroreductase